MGHFFRRCLDLGRRGLIVAMFMTGFVAQGRAEEMPKEVSATKKIKIYDVERKAYVEVEPIVKTEEEWKKELDKEQFCVVRLHDTEHPFAHKYNSNKRNGFYKCIACGTDLFSSENKFDSETGWPSYFQPVAPENIGTKADSSMLMERTEIHCARCKAHLGHVFEDGPPPTGLRYCINGAALRFIEQK